MNRPFRFAVQAMRLDDADAIRTLAKQAETLGYSELFSSDHIGLPDPFIPLVVAADATERLRVGPLVLNNELHHPALLARTAASIDRLTGGRLVLGLGTGYAQAEHDATGIPLRPPGRRVDRFAETVVALRSLLDHGTADMTGVHVSLAVDDLGIKPIGKVPLLIGGHGRRVVGIAGRHADIYQFTGLTHASDGTLSPGGFAPERLLERRDWLVEAAGARADDIERSALVQRTSIAADTSTERREAAERYGLSEAELDDCPFALIGSTEQVVDKIERLRESLGISHYVVRDPAGFAPIVDALDGR